MHGNLIWEYVGPEVAIVCVCERRERWCVAAPMGPRSRSNRLSLSADLGPMS